MTTVTLNGGAMQFSTFFPDEDGHHCTKPLKSQLSLFLTHLVSSSCTLVLDYAQTND